MVICKAIKIKTNVYVQRFVINHFDSPLCAMGVGIEWYNNRRGYSIIPEN